MELIAPGACTLPTAEQPLRVAEFRALFRHTVRAEPVSPTRARIHLDGPGLAGPVRDLARRESECCSFFRFTVTEGGQADVVLDVEVPPEHADVLAALLRLAP